MRLLVLAAGASILDFGAVEGQSGASALAANRAALLQALAAHAPGGKVTVPAGTFHTLGGIVAEGANCSDVELEVLGTLVADNDMDRWPLKDPKNKEHFFHFVNCSRLTISGGGTGLLDGQGKVWWDHYTFHPKKGDPKRPKLVVIEQATDVLVRDLELQNSPSFHLLLDGVERAEVKDVVVNTDRRAASRGGSGPGLQPEDLNTDGIDVAGRHVWIHGGRVLNDDDSIAIKPSNGKNSFVPCTENITIENMQLVGMGASIGSVPPHEGHNCVRNITFRNISMPQTGKGVYIKSNPTCGPNKTAEITNVVYEDVRIEEPRWWAIWIGPQQQHEPGSSLGDKCALTYPFSGQCPTQGCVTFKDIVLRRIKVKDPWLSPGVILGNATNPMQGLVFDDVEVDFGWHPRGDVPYGRTYKCTDAPGRALGKTSPVPPCFAHTEEVFV